MSDSHNTIAPQICILGYGRLAEALADRLSQVCSRVSVYARRSPPEGTNKVHFFNDVTQAINGARFVLAVTSDFASIVAILQDIDRLDGKTFIQISTLAPSQSLAVEREVTGRGGRYVENPVLGSRPEARSGTLIAMAGPAANIDDEVSAFIDLYSNRRIVFDAVGQASALKLIFNFLIGTLTASFSVALNAAQENRIDVDQFMGLLRESALYAPTFDKKLNQMLTGQYTNPNFPAEHLKKDLNLFGEVAHLSPLATAFVSALSDIAAAAADRQETKLDYSSLHEVVKGR
ncbi:MAG TPA: NAD-binding protein [Geobacterales bacterium]|nr:NAD-binding protein [Geobacterales bacterium]